MLDTCTFLDPRVKAIPYLSAAERAKVKDNVFLKLTELLSVDKDKSNAESALSEQAGPQQGLTGLSALLGDSYVEQSGPSSKISEDSINMELSRYVREANCPMDDNPLMW